MSSALPQADRKVLDAPTVSRTDFIRPILLSSRGVRSSKMRLGFSPYNKSRPPLERSAGCHHDDNPEIHGISLLLVSHAKWGEKL